LGLTHVCLHHMEIDNPLPEDTVAVILAAGKSTRMKSRLPKAVHPLCGRPMVSYIINACESAGISLVVVVVGHQGETVVSSLTEQAHWDRHCDIRFAWQTEQRGTGHALMAAMGAVPPAKCLLVLPGDTPLITGENLSELIRYHVQNRNDATLLTTVLPDGGHYGRIVRADDGSVLRIVEARDADPDTLAIREINTAIYCFNPERLLPALEQIRPDNNQGEYYLTDVIEILAKSGGRVGAITCPDSNVVLGINHRAELAQVEAVMRERILRSFMLAGVTVVDPKNTYIDADVEIAPDTVILPNTHITGRSKLAENCRIGPSAWIADSVLGAGVKVSFCYIYQSNIGENTVVGPFTHLGPNCTVGSGVNIGPFVHISDTDVPDKTDVRIQADIRMQTRGDTTCKD